MIFSHYCALRHADAEAGIFRHYLIAAMFSLIRFQRR